MQFEGAPARERKKKKKKNRNFAINCICEHCTTLLRTHEQVSGGEKESSIINLSSCLPFFSPVILAIAVIF
jgi:hypothetical protein